MLYRTNGGRDDGGNGKYFLFSIKPLFKEWQQHKESLCPQHQSFLRKSSSGTVSMCLNYYKAQQPLQKLTIYI